MPTSITLDLNDLTQANVDEAMPHMGACSYSSPCIIGSLMTPEQRETLAATAGYDTTDINALVEEGVIAFADPDQLIHAMALQELFDAKRPSRLAELLPNLKVNP